MSDASPVTTSDDLLAPLLADLFDGGLDAQRFRTLEMLVRDDPVARRRYRHYVRLHAALETELLHPQERGPDGWLPPSIGRTSSAAADSANRAPTSSSSAARSGRGWRRMAWALSLLLLVMFGYRVVTQPPIALVIAADGVVTTGEPPAVGQPLATRTWSIERGMLRLRLHTGATVVIRAPTTFTVTTANAVDVVSGTVLAEVPPTATGFLITTPHARVIDLGTEFAVQVTPATGTSIQVRRGHVQVASALSPVLQDIVAGEARAVDAIGQIRITRFDADIFSEPRTTKAQPTLARLRLDPALVGLYGGGPQAQTVDRWQSQRPSSSAGEAIIAQPTWISGRFPGTSAVAFTRPEDHVRLDVPGNFTALTLWTWVQIQARNAEPLALCATDGWGAPPLMQWLCQPDGRFTLHAYSPTGRIWNWTSERAMLAPSAQWRHLAVTCSDAGLVRFFCDGDLLGEQQHRHAVGFSIGPVNLGNWRRFARPGPQRPSGRHLSGAMDEFGILSRELSAVEVSDLAREGAP